MITPELTSDVGSRYKSVCVGGGAPMPPTFHFPPWPSVPISLIHGQITGNLLYWETWAVRQRRFEEQLTMSPAYVGLFYYVAPL